MPPRTAYCPRAATRRHVLVAGLGELREQCRAIKPRAARQLDLQLLQRGRRGDIVIETRVREDHDFLFPRSGQRLHQRQSFGRRLGIGQRALDRGAVGLWKKERAGVPVEQLIVRGLLRPHVRADNPHAPFRHPRHQRRDHGPRAVHHMLKHHRRHASTHRSQLLREERGGGEFV